MYFITRSKLAFMRILVKMNSVFDVSAAKNEKNTSGTKLIC